MKYTFDRVVRLVIALAVIVVVALLVNRLSSVLLPFLIGWLLAYLIHPMVKFVQYKMRVGNRGVSIFITLLSISVVLIGLFVALIPAISNEVRQIADYRLQVANYRTQFVDNEFVVWLNRVIGEIDVEKWLNPETLKGALESLLPSVKGLVSGTWEMIAGVFVVFVVFLYVVFILIDYEKINRGAREMIPPKYRVLVGEILDDVEVGMNKYFRGQSLVALIVGVMFAIGFKIVGLPMAITIGLFIGVLNLVPYLQTIGVVPVVLLCLVKSANGDSNFWLVLLGCFIVFLVVQGIQDLFLVPKIMGKAMGLNPAVILLSLSVWGSLLGIVGMIIALPITTLLISYYKRFVLNNEKLGVRSEE
jgi:predicted PurR-regulated permease PerM